MHDQVDGLAELLQQPPRLPGGHRAQVERGQVRLAKPQRAVAEPVGAALPVAFEQPGLDQGRGQAQDGALGQPDGVGELGEREAAVVADVFQDDQGAPERG